ncbi:hypothetical protein HanPI659440_Chr07g0252771 [Helianthus annuus]|nr:hypothetical protein HanPI659440_Chr07g0252771 [Helianthus annuus]
MNFLHKIPFALPVLPLALHSRSASISIFLHRPPPPHWPPPPHRPSSTAFTSVAAPPPPSLLHSAATHLSLHLRRRPHPLPFNIDVSIFIASSIHRLPPCTGLLHHVGPPPRRPSTSSLLRIRCSRHLSSTEF